MTTDARDRILLEHAPLVAMPRYDNFPPLDTPGHRFIAAEDGLWLELTRPWLHLTWPVAESAMALPYGPMLADEIEFAFSDEELARVVNQFIYHAKNQLPNEYAAWALWDEDAQRLVYCPLVAMHAGPGGITFHRPTLKPHEHLAVDIHSHGTLPAFFSATDDEDDEGAVKLAVVVGNLDQPELSFARRLCALGLVIDYDTNDTEAP